MHDTDSITKDYPDSAKLNPSSTVQNSENMVK